VCSRSVCRNYMYGVSCRDDAVFVGSRAARDAGDDGRREISGRGM